MSLSVEYWRDEKDMYFKLKLLVNHSSTSQHLCHKLIICATTYAAHMPSTTAIDRAYARCYGDRVTALKKLHIAALHEDTYSLATLRASMRSVFDTSTEVGGRSCYLVWRDLVNWYTSLWSDVSTDILSQRLSVILATKPRRSEVLYAVSSLLFDTVYWLTASKSIANNALLFLIACDTLRYTIYPDGDIPVLTDILDEVIGNPFVLVPATSETVTPGTDPYNIATYMRSSSDYSDAPILADALEDYDSSYPRHILDHLRLKNRRHYPCCFAVDAVLGLDRVRLAADLPVPEVSGEVSSDN